MARPGIVITSRAEPPPRSAPTDTGMAFFVGPTASGDAVPKVVRSLTEYAAAFGDRTGATDMYDAVDVFFKEGGSKLTIVRADTGEGGGGITGALDALTKDYGPGQVVLPSSQDPDDQAAALAHAAENNRVALLDADPSADTAAELTALADAYDDDANGRYGALFAPSVEVPGIGGAGARTVSVAALTAGIISRNDARFTANEASAGVNGESRYGTDVTTRFTNAEYTALNDAGVNAIRSMYGGVRVYGYRTLADLDSGWGLLSNARLNMEIVAQAEVVAERYVFAQIDGRRVKISQFGADLAAILVPLYDAGALFGTSPSDAFFVDTGAAVNTLETIANGELRAVLAVRMSAFAEMVEIEIVKVPVETPLAVAA